MAETVENQNFNREVYETWVEAKRSDSLDVVYRATLQRLDNLIESGDRHLFDVGAGAGEFLALGRDVGFTPHGNELAPGAIEMAKEREGIDLHFGDLATVEGENLYDALTMWCVLAHVSEPDELLRNVHRVLKPGGVLYLQTPRWSAMDTIAMGAARASGGRLVRILDRRVNKYHMTLNSVAGLTSEVNRLGFEVIELRPRARYGMKTNAYMRSLGLSPRVSDAAASVLDTAVERELIFRNVLDLYARKPLR